MMAIMMDSFDRLMVANIMEMKMIDDICQRCGQAIRAMSRMTGMMRRSRFQSNDHCCDKCEDD